MKRFSCFATTAAVVMGLGFGTLPLMGQKMATAAGEAPGPWILGTIGVGKTEDPKVPKTTALKGIAIKVGEKGEAAVAYDLDLCRMVGAWTGKFTTPMNLMSRGEYPTAMGEVAFTSSDVPGFFLVESNPAPSDRARDYGEPTEEMIQKRWRDSRGEPFGPLAQGQVRFRGFYVHGDKRILKWEVGGTEVLELPRYEMIQRGMCFTRTLVVAPHKEWLGIAICDGNAVGNAWRGGSTIFANGREVEGQYTATNIEANGQPLLATICATNTKAITLGFTPKGAASLAPSDKPQICKIVLRPGQHALEEAGNVGEFALDSADWTKGGPARWPEPVVTTGEVSAKTDEAYVVDTIKLPDPNPWGAPMFVGGFDFFPDGRAAVCTFHGDVFVVSGIDEKLEKVTWRRVASGLYHALGLKVVKGEIYVTCRDGIWRLKDLNGDGETDFYELFNGDVKVTKSFHEFVFDLQADPAGNFYFAKAGPVKNGGRGFDQIVAHHGSILRVSADGSKLEVVATGFRAPNGIGCGPDGQLTSGDNEGTWTPVCKINWVKPGGFYGVVPLSHRDPLPSDYDRPLCWLPKRVDNSGGGQVWVTSEKWGPWKDQLLHLSYGTCSVFGVMKEKGMVPAEIDMIPAKGSTSAAGAGEKAVPPVKGKATTAAATADSRKGDGASGELRFDWSPGTKRSLPMQGGVVRFPLNFQSGIMRARFNPVDGQLYVAGLRGWQTSGVKNGAFQRVRYTGAPVRMPIGLQATKKGMRIDFTCALDPKSAGDPQNWNVEVWNYLWSSAYGSPELSTMGEVEKPGELGKDGEPQFTKAQAAQKKHDPLAVKSVTVSADGKSVFLEIPEIKPVMQMAIKFGVTAADGAEVRSEIVNTIHALGE